MTKNERQAKERLYAMKQFQKMESRKIVSKLAERYGLSEFTVKMELKKGRNEADGSHPHG